MKAEVVLYSSGWCPYCMRARALLERRSATIREVDVDDAEQRAEMIRLTGRRTVPQVVIGGRHIGGFEELHQLDRTGELEKLLEQESP